MLSASDGGGGRRCSYRVLAEFLEARRELQWLRTYFGQTPMKEFALERSAVLWPVFVRAPLRGFSCARRQLALLLRLCRPAGYGFPRNLVRKVRRKDFSGPSANAELRHLG